jgi:hypothetical protein
VLTIALIAGAVLVIDAVSNIYLGRLLLQQSRLLTQAAQTLNAACNVVASLAERLADADQKKG